MNRLTQVIDLFKRQGMRFNDYVDLDKMGISLSFICGLHCFITPFIMMSLPLMGRYYLVHPWFHFLMAALILPIGIIAFRKGFKHHRNKKVFYFGIPGLLLVSLSPLMVHGLGILVPEYPLMILGSCLLITGHWINRRSCGCDAHSH